MSKEFNEKIMELLPGWYDDPVLFVHQAFPWGQKGGPLAGWNGLDEWQEKFMRDMAAKIETSRTTNESVLMAVASGNGIGKSALISLIILWFMTTRQNVRIRVTANTEQQLNSTTWRELALWHTRMFHRDWFVWEKTSFYHVSHPTNWRAEAIPWSENNPDAFAGVHAEHNVLIMDEASGVAQSIWEASLGFQTTAGAVHLAFGNPLRPSGGFYECFHGKVKRLWDTRNIDSRTAAAATNKKYFDELVLTYGEDSDIVRRRVRGLFPRHGATQFISSEIVADAAERVIHNDEVADYPVTMGVDVARFGDDRSCIVLRRGPKVLSIESFEGLDGVELAEQVVGVLRANKDIAMCYIDEVGVGSGVLDITRRYDTRAIGVNVGRRAHNPKTYRDMRAELWGRMKDWLTKADIKDDEQLRKDLVSPEYALTDAGQIRLERKTDMKKRGVDSPDVADALALTFTLPPETEAGWYSDDDIMDRLRVNDSYTADAGRSAATGY